MGLEEQTSMRDRVVGFRRVLASKLVPHPMNWRRHGTVQRSALRGIIAEIGFADVLIVREIGGGELQILDGHLRAETVPTMEVPVVVVDLDDEEARKLLVTHDPIAALAEVDGAMLNKLLEDVKSQDQGVDALLATLRREAATQLAPEVDPRAEWEGMPEFVQENDPIFRTIIVHFNDVDAVEAFMKLMDQPITEQTRFIWYPYSKRNERKTTRYEGTGEK